MESTFDDVMKMVDRCDDLDTMTDEEIDGECCQVQYGTDPDGARFRIIYDNYVDPDDDDYRSDDYYRAHTYCVEYLHNNGEVIRAIYWNE